MALVDYSSESDPDGDSPSPGVSPPTERSAKRRKSSAGVPVPVPVVAVPHPGSDRDAKTEGLGHRESGGYLQSGGRHEKESEEHASLGDHHKREMDGKEYHKAVSDLPPLPDEFYDLYASTVRTSVVDDPKLHQGRKRLIPHVVGNWPSHLYLEWHPSFEEHAALVALLEDIQNELGTRTKLATFLTSDLGAPLPLHVSLSRPIVLTTAHKDDFLEKITEGIHSSGVHHFHLSPRNLAWYSSPDSNRTFLVLKVSVKDDPSNALLARLLQRCNSVVRSFDQPVLYERGEHGTVDEMAFHVSLAWTFDLPDEDACVRALALLGSSESEKHSGIAEWEVEVTGVKAKIGNVVTHLALPERATGRMGKNLFAW